MAGTLYFDGGGGADTMTGGDGVNVYEFGAVSDSTGSAMDIITNFNVAVDLIDMTGLATPFSGAAALASGATSLGAASIGWQTVGGNTFVYANTHAQAEALGATDTTIELQGNVALTANNFAYV
jgi:Ca2+-binding RTX toxin-like protein